jgi:hypothetical protein
MRELERATIRLLGVLACVIGLALVGCGGDDDEDNLSGNYQGTIQDSLVGTGTITATLVQNDSTVTGTFQTSFPAGTSGGSLSGTRNGDAFTFILTPSQPLACPLNVAVTVDGDEIQGTYAAFNCPVAETGSFTLTRQ